MFHHFSIHQFLLILSISSLSNAVENKFQPVVTTNIPISTGSYLSESVRIISNFINSYSVQCPGVTKVNGQKVRFEELYWLNENFDYQKPDASVIISSSNLLEKSQLTVRIDRSINHLSCGYLHNNKYVRIKLWTFNYVDTPTISLRIITNPNIVTLKNVNSTAVSISVPNSINVSGWNSPIDLLRLKCVTNYDIPLDTKYVWMYFKNPTTNIHEIWHRDDIKGIVDPYQIFMYDMYNSVSNRNKSLSEFIKPLLLGQINSIEFQCASYKDRFQLLAKSHNTSLVKGNWYPYHTTTAASPVYDNGPLIGGIIGGVLGLLVLLGLVLLIVWCCCFRRTRDKDSNQVYYNQKNLASQSVVSGYPSDNNIEITHDGWRNLNASSSAFMHYPAQSTHTIESTKHHSTVEISNLNSSNQHALSSSNLSNFQKNHHNGQATVRSEVPEVFLKTITLPKDANDDFRNGEFSYIQKDITYNNNNGYITDQEFIGHRNEYFSHNNNFHTSQYDKNETQFQYV